MSDYSASPHAGLRAALERWTTNTPTLTPHPIWLAALARFGVALGGAEQWVERFLSVWGQLYSASLLLDHLQDGDELGDPWLAAQPQPLQYHLALSAYAFANSEVGILSKDLPGLRGQQLQELWNTAVLDLAAGQYLDLTLPAEALHDMSAALDLYEEIAGQKTGAAFALALGGCAAVATEDARSIDAAVQAGVLIGLLLQYHDDLLDQEAQSTQAKTITLARALTAQFAIATDELPLALLWALVYHHYRLGLNTVLAALPEAAQALIWELVEGMFGPAPVLPVADIELQVSPPSA